MTRLRSYLWRLAQRHLAPYRHGEPSLHAALDRPSRIGTTAQAAPASPHVTSLAALVDAELRTRREALDTAVHAVRSYQRAVAAMADLAEATAHARDWAVVMTDRLQSVWADLDAVRWDAPLFPTRGT